MLSMPKHTIVPHNSNNLQPHLAGYEPRVIHYNHTVRFLTPGFCNLCEEQQKIIKNLQKQLQLKTAQIELLTAKLKQKDYLQSQRQNYDFQKQYSQPPKESTRSEKRAQQCQSYYQVSNQEERENNFNLLRTPITLKWDKSPPRDRHKTQGREPEDNSLLQIKDLTNRTPFTKKKELLSLKALEEEIQNFKQLIDESQSLLDESNQRYQFQNKDIEKYVETMISSKINSLAASKMSKLKKSKMSIQSNKKSSHQNYGTKSQIVSAFEAVPTAKQYLDVADRVRKMFDTKLIDQRQIITIEQCFDNDC